MVENRMPTLAARPRVIATFAMTLDGKISTRTLAPSLFTSPRDKQHLLNVRSLGDAVMVGRGTLEADTMSMTIPVGPLTEARVARGQVAQPFRVVVSASGKVSPELKIFKTAGGPVVIATTTDVPQEVTDQLEPIAAIWRISPRPLDMGAMLHRMKTELQVRTLVCEGGAGLFRSLVKADLVDELHLTVAPRLFGGMGAPTITGLPAGFLDWPLPFELVDAREVDGEVFVHYRRARD